MKNKIKKFFIFNMMIFSSIITLANTEVPNVIIKDSSELPASILELEKKKDKAELNLKVKKMTSKKLEEKYDKYEDIYYIELPELISQDEGIYLTSNYRKIKENKLKISNSEIEYLLDGNRIEVSNTSQNKSKRIYILKYNKNTKELLNVYVVDRKSIDNEYLQNHLDLEFTDNYIAYTDETLSRTSVSENVKVLGGEIIEISEEINKLDILSLTGEKLGSINLSSGSGGIGLDNSSNGIKLRNSKGYLNFGIGFENKKLKLKLKEWSFAENKYTFLIKGYGKNRELDYLISLKPALHKLKLNKCGINLDFGEVSQNETQEITATFEDLRIQMPESVGTITVKFLDEGKMNMYLDDNSDSILAMLSSEVVEDEKVIEGYRNMNIKLKGKIVESIKNKKPGNYKGTSELLILIDL